MRTFTPIPIALERIASETIDAVYKVHKSLGPGLLESVYEKCLAYELSKRGLRVETQVPMPVVYEGVGLDAGLRLDLLVERQLIVEIKSVEVMHPVFEAQLLTYLKLTGRRVGFLNNFNVPLIKNGIKRMIL
jgi:GxxExxY protein